jgi:hypothetical protein
MLKVLHENSIKFDIFSSKFCVNERANIGYHGICRIYGCIFLKRH